MNCRTIFELKSSVRRSGMVQVFQFIVSALQHFSKNTNSMGRVRIFVVFFLVVLVAPVTRLQAQDGSSPAYPELNQRVTDLTGTLTEGQVQSLEQKLKTLEENQGTQIAILLVPTTEPLTIETYSIELAEKWKIGREGVDDGIIMILAKEDRKFRIEVGYGLEGAVPDLIANRIVEDVAIPRFKEGDFFGGLNQASAALIHYIEKEELPPPENGGAGEGAFEGGLSGFGIGIIVFYFIFSGFLNSIFPRLIALILASGIGFLLGYFLVSSITVGIFLAFLGIFRTLGGGSSGSGGGFSTGGFSTGGFSGGGFSTGGFSGGGGSFGGGGASGSW